MKNKKQILYLSYDGMTDPLGQSQVLPYLCHLTKNGYQFTLVSCEKKDRYLQNKTIIEKICAENNIDWQPIFYTKKPPVLSTIWDIYKLNKKVKQLHKKKQFQLIHCRSYITALIGLAFKQKKGISFIFDMRGFWADERVDGNIWNLNNPVFKKVYAFFKQKERDFLEHADQVISLTENGKQEMLSWNIPHLTPAKISVIPCAADYELFSLADDEKRAKAKQNLELSNTEFVLSYIGSIGTWYMLDEMLDFFKELIAVKTNAKFLFITKDCPTFILDKCEGKGISKTAILVRSSSREDVPEYVNTSNASIFFIKPVYSKKASSPKVSVKNFGLI